jgi:hypothetical protein
MNKPCLTLCLLLAAGLCATAADTKSIKNRDGNCELSIPTTWSVDAFGGAQSPDKKMSLTVSSPKHGLSTLDQVHQMAPGVYTDDKVIKDSSSEFEMAGKSITGKPNAYRAVPAGDKVCIVEVMYENGDAAGAKAIVESLKPAK